MLKYPDTLELEYVHENQLFEVCQPLEETAESKAAQDTEEEVPSAEPPRSEGCLSSSAVEPPPVIATYSNAFSGPAVPVD